MTATSLSFLEVVITCFSPPTFFSLLHLQHTKEPFLGNISEPHSLQNISVSPILSEKDADIRIFWGEHTLGMF